MFTADPLIRKIGETEHGTARLGAIADAIREADQANAHYWRFYFRFEQIKESIFYDDAFKAILAFPELLKIFDDHPELEDDFADDMLCAFKWILENSVNFYQISREQIDRNYEEYERRCKSYGVSMRAYHMKRCNYLLRVDQAQARAEYDAFHRCKRDGYSDCPACETHFDMCVALELGDVEEALRIAKPLLDGDQRCGEVPHYTYAKLADHYLFDGDLEEAAYYGELCDRITRGAPEFLDATGMLLSLYSATDPNRGWNLTKQCLPHYLQCKNQVHRLEFAAGAFRLMQVLAEIDEKNGSPGYTKAPVMRQLPLTWTEEGVRLADVRDYFYREAHDGARRLDERNGSTYYTDRLARTVVPVQLDAGLTEQPHRPAHGITKRQPCLLIVTLPDGTELSYEQLLERVRAAIPEDIELLNSSVDEEGMFLSFNRDKRVCDYAITKVEAGIDDFPDLNPVEDLDDATFGTMQGSSANFVVHCQHGDNAQLDYHFAMQLLSTLFPEMIGVTDIMNRHVYSGNWVRFKGRYEASVTPNDLFGLYLTGSQDKDEVWMTTLGMNLLGMRELEICGATTKNFSKMAEILDHIAALCVDQGMLPDEEQPFGVIYLDEVPYRLCWKTVKDLPEDSVAAGVDRALPSGMLMLETDNGMESIADSELIDKAQSIEYPSGNHDFYRRIALAKETAPIFLEAVQSPFERAAVRLEFQLDDERRKQFGYGVELLWAEIAEVDGDTIRAAVKETSEALPELQEDTIVTVDPEKLAAWFIQPKGEPHPFSAQDAYYIWKENQI